jgi:hypothetical protein
MKLIHEAVIEGREIFETLGARFFEPFEEEDLGARVDLFQELAQLGHGVAAGWDTEDIVHEALDELLREILTAEVALREFSCGEKLVEGDGLGRKWDGGLLTSGHADGPQLVREARPSEASNSTGPPGARQVHRRRSHGLSRKTGEDASGVGSTHQGRSP